MVVVPHRARRIARAAAWIAIGLALTAGAVAGGPESDSIAISPPLGGASWGGIGGAGGGFRVTPTRVVFEQGFRSAELTLVNTGSEPTTYRISLTRMRMSDDGAIAEVADLLPGETCADSLVRFSPRQVDLEPGVPQTVRMQLRKPANLPSGEYRSHLVFRALPSLESEAGGPGGTRGVSIALRPAFGAAIPVIVRHGETAATVDIAGVELRRRPDAEGGPCLALELRRAGSRSVYGDLMVTFAPRGGRPRMAGGLRGLAVYTPNPVRRVLVPLRADGPIDWAAGTFQVDYRETGAEPRLLAEAELALP